MVNQDPLRVSLELFENNAGTSINEAAVEAPVSINLWCYVTGQQVLFDNKTLNGAIIVNGYHTVKYFDKN